MNLVCEKGNSKLVEVVTESYQGHIKICVRTCDMTLAYEDANSKLVEVVTVADVDDENRVGNSLLQI